MTFSICLEHFRAFDWTGFVKIRPITLLTGGNSAGKTSFLAGLRYLSDQDYLGSPNPSFNKDPFYLGAYEQIAHYRGGRHGRSKHFSLSYQGPALRARPSARGSGTHNVSFSITFGKKLSQPVVSKLTYMSDNSAFTFGFSDDWKRFSVRAQLNDQIFETELPVSGSITPETVTQNPSFIGFFLDGLFLDETDDDEDPELEQSSYNRALISRLASDIRAALASVPRSSYVGAPVRSRPLRTYDPIDVATQAEGSHVPSRLAQLARSEPQEWQRIQKALVDFGRSSSLFTDIEVRSLGRSDSDPFQLNVVINGPKRNIVDVGYGVSQAIPLVFELVKRSRGSMYIAQQPEVHLHPEAQAALGTLLVTELKRISGYAVIETHSDFLIDRIRRHVRKGDLDASDVSILYFQRKEHVAEIKEISIDKNGDVVDAPAGYRDFFMHEQIENLGL